MQSKLISFCGTIFQNENNNFFDLFFSLSNPVLYSFLFIFIFIALLLLIKKNILSPLKKEHEKEKARLVEKHVKQMALFAELDPGPLIRVDKKGIVINENSAAVSLNENNSLVGTDIKTFLDIDDLNMKELISEDQTASYNTVISSKYYNVTVKGVSEFNAAQIYLSDFTDRKNAENKLREYQKKLNARVEEERQKIARELHDSIGQDLSFLRLGLQKLEKSSEEEIIRQVKNSLSSIDSIGNSIREICNQLRPRVLEEGVEPAIAALITNSNRRNNIPGSIHFIGKQLNTEPEVEINIFRAVQEAITNILKHSKAQKYNVQYISSDEKILLIISDDGIGFNKNDKLESNIDDNTTSFGMLNMRERIESVGGRSSIESELNKGTTIVFEIPRGKAE